MNSTVQEGLMIRTAFVVLALAMPAYAMAQEHQHQHAASTAQSHTAEMKAHEDFVQSVIDKRASLQLTDAQVTKLKTFKTEMIAHHKKMMGDMKNMKHDSMSAMKHDMAGMKMEMKKEDAKKEGVKKEGMKMQMSMDDPMHKEFMAIFTPAQKTKVDALMKEHMKACGMGEDGQCKIEK